ncbi:hypothetical protein DFJ74DRAFT_256581 [Hyaloraphidium curvatum]|nr:hypothetical protein DFJ74DRAFT_256581 [Hyaloraphidium curvatum]
MGTHRGVLNYVVYALGALAAFHLVHGRLSDAGHADADAAFPVSALSANGLGFAFSVPREVPRAVLLLMPSCRATHLDFWILPELRRIVAHFVGRGYLAVAANGPTESKADRDVCCPDYVRGKGEQVPRTPRALEELWTVLGAAHPSLQGIQSRVPTFVYASSAGGFVTSMISANVTIRAAVFQGALPERSAVHAAHPPVLFTTTPFDWHATEQRIAASRKALEAVGVPSEVMPDETSYPLSTDEEADWDELTTFFPGAIDRTHSRAILKRYCATFEGSCAPNSTGDSSFRLNFAKLPERRSKFEPWVREYILSILPHAEAHYRTAMPADVLAWKTTSSDPGAELLFSFLVRSGVASCRDVAGHELCTLARPEVPQREWARLLADGEMAAAMRAKLVDYYLFGIEMAVQSVNHEHGLWTRGLVEGWDRWFEGFLNDKG